MALVGVHLRRKKSVIVDRFRCNSLKSSKRSPTLLINFDTRISSCSIVEANSFKSSTSLRASVVDLMVGAGG